MNERESKESIKMSEDVAINDACRALQTYTKQVQDCIAQLVASLCNVDLCEMLEEPKTTPFVQARWFYWYVLKQLYGETGEGISRITSKHRKFKAGYIMQGISKMSMMIQEGTIWTKRWSILKRVIGDANKVEQPELFMQNITVKVIHPQGVNIELKQE